MPKKKDKPDPKPPDLNASERTLRRYKNSASSEYCIETAFGNVVNNLLSKGQLKILKDDIRNRSIAMSKGMHRGSIALNLFLRDEFNKCIDPYTFKLTNFLSKIKDNDENDETNGTTFLRQLILGQKDVQKKNKVVEKFLTEFEHLLPPVQQRFPGDKNTITSAAEKYLTCFRTHLTEEFINIQESFLKLWSSINEEDPWIIRDLINYSSSKKSYALNKNSSNFIIEQRAILGLRHTIRSNDDENEKEMFIISKETLQDPKIYVSNNYEKVIIYIHTMSKYMIENECRGFLVAPLCKMKTMFIHIDTDVFFDICKTVLDKPTIRTKRTITKVVNGIKVKEKILQSEDDKNNLSKINFNEFKQKSEYWWSKVFNTLKFLTEKQKANNNFTGTIDSNGYAISIHYRRPKIISEKLTYLEQMSNELEKREDTDRVIGVDTGRVILFYGVEQLKDGTWKTYTLTRRQYYQESGIFKNQKDTERWSLKIKDALIELSKFSTRSTYDDFLGYVKVILKYYDSLWNEYTKSKYVRNRLNLYSGKQRTYDNFFNTMKNPNKKLRLKETIVFAYGNGTFSSSNPNEISAPTTRLLRETKKHGRAAILCEFKSTQNEYGTGIRLGKVGRIVTEKEAENKLNELKKRNIKDEVILKNIEDKIKKSIGWTRAIRGLLYCYSNISNKLVGRDLNAAKNMLWLYRTYPLRPLGYNREDPSQPLPPMKYLKVKD